MCPCPRHAAPRRMLAYRQGALRAVPALCRAYLGSFMLPGEAQKIDRMMEAFASWYCENNVGKFSHEDTCYVLAFATIMLNTSLHNPSVKDKQSLDAFLNMNRGIDQGQDLDIGILTVRPSRVPP